MEDTELAAAAALGDQEAFAELIRRYRSYIYTIAYRIVLNEDDALDITQNVYVRLVEKIGDYSGRGLLRAWIATIAAREAVNFCRRPSARELATEPEVLRGLSDHEMEHGSQELARQRHPAELLEVEERRKLVGEAMEQLSPQQRAIFALRLLEDLGPNEIAKQLELPAKQVRSQLSRAIERIRRIVAEKSRE